jgi:DNA mismatch repair protein MutS2
MKSQIPGVVHDASNSGMTLFVEPFSTVNLCNSWRELGLEEEREVMSVLRELSNLVSGALEEIEESLRAATRLDFIIARAKYSESIIARCTLTSSYSDIKTPHFKKHINLVNARHPLLGQDAVPLSIEMRPEWKILVITGPNTGGKTVALKTIGLLAAMQQSGILISSEADNNLPIFDGIYADIGDQQDINDSVSTFSSHIKNIDNIIRLSSSNSLVLLDEVGSSTDPEEGAAIASAVLQHFSEHSTTTIATTHHQSVAAIAETDVSISNASFHLDPNTLKPTYKMSVGVPGRSYAMSVAASLGFSKTILEKAQNNLSPNHKKISSMLTDISREREELSEILLDSKKLQDQIVSIRNSLQKQLEFLVQKREEIIESVEAEVRRRYQEIGKILARAESALSWSKHSSTNPNNSDPLNIELEAIKNDVSQIEIPKPAPIIGSYPEIKVGDSVYIKTLRLNAKIYRLTHGNREAEVGVGTIRMNVNTSDLTVLEEVSIDDNANIPNKTFVEKLDERIPEIQLDIRGLRAEPALYKVEMFLDSSIRNGLSKVRIVHGKGTGALRLAVRDSLKGHPLVSEFGKELDSSGGDGATYVLLN